MFVSEYAIGESNITSNDNGERLSNLQALLSTGVHQGAVRSDIDRILQESGGLEAISHHILKHKTSIL